MSFSTYNPIPSHRKRDLEPSNPRIDNLASNRFAQIRQAKPISKHETRAFSRKSSLIARVVRSYCASCIELPPLSLSLSLGCSIALSWVGRVYERTACSPRANACILVIVLHTHARVVRGVVLRDAPSPPNRPRGSVGTIPPLLGTGAACFIAVTWYGCDVTRSLTILCPRH